MRLHPAIILCALPLLAGCVSFTSPHHAEGSWRPSGANELNLRAMVAQPRELVVGASEVGADGHAAVDAVERLRTDRVRTLPVFNVSPIGAATGGGTSP
jgi:hypothetical protein